MYDLIVIGGGPSGYRAAELAGKSGLKTALITDDFLGGTCLNRGCIPTKSFFSDAKKGIKNPQSMWEKKNNVVEKLRSGIAVLMKHGGVSVFNGRAELKDVSGDVKTISFYGKDENTVFETKKIIIAAGSEVAMPQIPGIDNKKVLTSDDALEGEMIDPEKVRSIVIIGGGFIAAEFAWLFNKIGIEVTLLIRRDIIMSADSTIRTKLSGSLRKQGVSLVPWFVPDSIEEADGQLKVKGRGKKGPGEYLADRVLVCTGRRPVLHGLGLESSEIIYDSHGIKADKYFQTNIEGVYATGDINGQSMLAHTAEYQALAAVYHMTGRNYEVNYGANPWCVFTWPEVAGVGITEEEAKEMGIEYITGKSFFMANGMALAMDEPEGLIKVIADNNGLLLGIHMIGPDVSTMISEAALAVDRKLTASDVAHTIHPHPTLGECFRDAMWPVVETIEKNKLK